MSKKLLFVSTRQFWPTTTGKEITLYHNCKGLHEQYGYDIYLFCFADKNANKSKAKPSFIYDVEYADVPSVKNTLGTIIMKSLLGKWPIQNSLFYSDKNVKKLLEYYHAVKPNAIIIDMVRLVPYFDKLPCVGIPKILIEDDLLARRYKQQIESSGAGNVAGYFSNSLPGSINKLSSFRPIKNTVLRFEAKRLIHYEAILSKKFDYITFISPVEAAEFNQQYQTDKALTLTMGADVEYCATGIANDHIPHSLSIVGNFSYAPNAASLEWISKEVLPLLPKEIVYYVIGKYPDELKKRIADERIKALGYVDDIRTVVKSTDVYLCPIAYGTGIKTKVVEGMAMGMPVVTNSIGAEGLNVTNGRELFIVDDPQEMAQIVRKLLEDAELRSRIGKQGQQFVRAFHDWNRIYEVFGHMGL